MTDQNLATIYDEAAPGGTAGNGAAAPDSSAIRAAAKEVKTNVTNMADHAAARAKEAYRQSKVMAGQRAEQARTAIIERPWAAAGVIFLAGMVAGRMIMGGAPRVIYLRDRG
jgi:ElaB/YqjD/DUF883 family membrane-anchored ribosome-binding protein